MHKVNDGVHRIGGNRARVLLVGGWHLPCQDGVTSLAKSWLG